MKRLRNEWRQVRDGKVLPFILWRTEGELSAMEFAPDSRRRLGCWLVPPEVVLPDVVSLEILLSLLAIRLQAGNSDRVHQWLLDNFSPVETGVPGYPFVDEHLAVACGLNAARTLRQFLELAAQAGCQDTFLPQADKLLAAVMAQASRRRPRDTIHEIMLLAVKRGIPVKKFSDMPSYCLGHGAVQQHLWNGFTSHTSHLATIISTHKPVTIDVLGRHGFPVPRQFVVSDRDKALAAASRLGYPVVVKPTSADFGTAVSVNIRGDRELVAAFEQASQHGSVLVEQMIAGHDHRLHIINGRCTYVAKQFPPTIVGDGVRTVSELINALAELRAQDDFLRRFKSASLDDPLVVDLLREQGVGADSVVPAGTTILLRSNSNVSTGGSFIDVTHLAHTDNVLMAERAAKCIGLDHAGVDFIITDIARSWREVGGAICEVNPTPAVSYQYARETLLDYLFPQGGNGRISIAVIVGTPEQAFPYLERVKSVARERLLTAGLVVQGRGYIGDVEVTVGNRPSVRVVDELVADRDITLLVVQLTPRELLAQGLNIGYCDVAAFLVDENVVESVLQSPHSILRHAGQIQMLPSPETFVRQLQL